jgi:signal transduction histidine kinase
MIESVGFVFSGIRHELGNPINSVKVALSVLREHLDEYSRDTIERYVDRALTEVGRVEYLLKTLKSASANERPRMEALPLAPFLRGFRALISEDCNARGIELCLAADGGTDVIRADPRALHQVLLNLVANSADALHGRSNAMLILRAARGQLSGPRPRIEIVVEDNGSGMTPAQQQDLFKPFMTTKRQGTGLGLVISRNLMAAMQGTIEVETMYDVGTIARLTLDLADPVPGPSA